MIEYQVGDYVCIRGEDGFVKNEWLITSKLDSLFILSDTTYVSIVVTDNEDLNENYEYAGTKTRYNRFTQQEKDLYLPV